MDVTDYLQSDMYMKQYQHPTMYMYVYMYMYYIFTATLLDVHVP